MTGVQTCALPILTVQHEIMDSLKAEYEISVVSLVDHIEKNLRDNFDSHAMEKVEERLIIMRKKYHKELVRIFEINKYDVVIAVHVYSAFLAFSYHKRKYKFLFWDHGALANQLSDKKITIMRYFSSSFSDMSIVLTERTRNDYITRFHSSPRKVITIPNPVPKVDMELIGVPQMKAKRIITVGRFSPEKGFDLLINVACIVLRENPDWEWDIYGDGETYELIKSDVKNAELAEQLHLWGKDPNVIERYKGHSLYVMTSYREGLPMVLLEAQLNGLPIVSFDIATGPAEIVIDGVNGYLVKPYDIKEMARKIQCLIDDESLRVSFSQHSKDKLDYFSLGKVKKKWIEIINR